MATISSQKVNIKIQTANSMNFHCAWIYTKLNLVQIFHHAHDTSTNMAFITMTFTILNRIFCETSWPYNFGINSFKVLQNHRSSNLSTKTCILSYTNLSINALHLIHSSTYFIIVSRDWGSPKGRACTGVVTLIGPVEPFTTGIKWNQRINMSICNKSSNQGTFQRTDQVAHRRVKLNKTNL